MNRIIIDINSIPDVDYLSNIDIFLPLIYTTENEMRSMDIKNLNK